MYNLTEDDVIIDNDREISSIFNDFNLNIVSNLNIPQYEDQSVNLENINDLLEKVGENIKTLISFVKSFIQNVIR